jgi:hypothetical protein
VLGKWRPSDHYRPFCNRPRVGVEVMHKARREWTRLLRMKREREKELSYRKERDSFIMLLERGMEGSSIIHPS